MPVPVIEDVEITFMASAGSSIDANYPDPLPSGSLIIAQLWAGGTIPTPTGWEFIRAQGETTFGSGETRTYFRITDGEEGPTQEFTWTDTMFGNVAMARVSGFDAVAPINISAGAAGPNTDTQTSPAVETDVIDCLILRMLAADRIAVAPVTPPAGHDEEWDADGAVSFDASVTVGASIAQPGAGDSGTADFVMSTSRPVALQTIAIAGAAAGGNASRNNLMLMGFGR